MVSEAFRSLLGIVCILLASALVLSPQTAALDFLNHNRPVLDAHNPSRASLLVGDQFVFTSA
jgi:hypothetical protein